MFRLNRKGILGLALALFSTLPAAASAATLLAGDQAGNLYSVDTTTGIGTPIGQETQFPLSTEIEYDPGTGILYADETNGSLNLHTIDLTTGLSTGFVAHPCCALNGMEFVGTTLYATNIEGSGAPSTLVIVDVGTGGFTPVGLTGFGPISGLAYETGSSTMYGVTAGGAPATLLTIDLTTGVATPVAPLADAAGAPIVRVGSIEFGSDGVLYGGVGLNGSPNPGWLFSIDTTTGVSTFIGPTGLAGITGLTDAVTGAPDYAGFTVTKTFSDGLVADVEVAISCNDGFVNADSATISSDGGSFRFIVTEFISGSMDCEITETATAGYDTDSCTFTNVTGGEYTCDLFNDAEDGTFSVTKTWDILGQDVDAVDQDVVLVIDCESDISNPMPLPCDIDTPDSTQCVWTLDWDGLGLGDSVTASVDVDTSDGDAYCTAYETGIDASEVESSDDCDPRMLVEAAGSNGCTITNTVFFEGIPTLSQYGLALMALLMLGVGMIGFRRFA